ncbi:sugar transferase [Arthrobacter zhangbolii]|uniref:Sugar transferase n=1 Tax=Arthrobacter zhangbolii TaxID=2886936 RepID=A0A9X1M8U0_9MICC|nr:MULTISPECIES: sugar transferase [Arthrobacter]MCC3272957.1 sugar transferase [Arthrobacter zhangbolii]MDN3905269.1 sugar transferase [Arthrobacter sp. YD2]UON93006.1 sugar transferase [Arthrobacter zhangbolii]
MAQSRSTADIVLPVQPFVFPSFTTARHFGQAGRTKSAAVVWNRRYARILTVSDAVVVFTAALVGHAAWFGLEEAKLRVGPFAPTYLIISCLIGLAWMLALQAYRSRDARITGIGTDEYKRVVNATVALMGTLALVSVVFQIDIARGYFGLVLPGGTAGLIAARWLLRRWLQMQRRKGKYLSRVVVLGQPRDVRYVVNQIGRKSRAAYQVVGVALTGKKRAWLEVNGAQLPVVSDAETVVEAVARVGADAVIVAGQTKGGSRYIQELGWQLEESSTELILTTGLTNVAGPRIHARPVEGLPLMHVELPQYTGARHAFKRIFDVVVSCAALLALVPLFAMLAILVKKDSPGPVLFRQERVGRGGRKFLMLKFRSMVETAEDDLAGLLDQNEGAGLMFKIQNDPRITRVGAWMRRYSLDELPQFWNVLIGDMSLVGPRPPLQREVDSYEKRVHRRLYIKPGITGMWQTNGRSNLSWQDSIRLDLYYVENWSLTGDLIILWRTAVQMVKPLGAF